MFMFNKKVVIIPVIIINFVVLENSCADDIVKFFCSENIPIVKGVYTMIINVKKYKKLLG